MPKHNKLTVYHYTEDLFQQGIDDNILIPGKYILIPVGTNPSSWNPPHLVVGNPYLMLEHSQDGNPPSI